MSKFTGKSDFYDWCEMHNEPSKIIKIAKVYLGDAKVDTTSEKELIPYYTHLIASMACTPDMQSINLSKESFIDSEEKDFLSWKIELAIKSVRKAKKEKTAFNYDFLMKQKEMTYETGETFLWRKIIDVINKYPDVIKEHIPASSYEARNYISNWLIPKYFNDVHDSMHNRMREDFVAFAAEHGYSTIKIINGKPERTEGVYHPVINEMGFHIWEYHLMVTNFGD